jgi:hypothetical protein
VKAVYISSQTRQKVRDVDIIYDDIHNASAQVLAIRWEKAIGLVMITNAYHKAAHTSLP